MKLLKNCDRTSRKFDCRNIREVLLKKNSRISIKEKVEKFDRNFSIFPLSDENSIRAIREIRHEGV